MRVSNRFVSRAVSSVAAAVLSTAAFAATYVVPADETLIRRADAIVVARALTSYAEESRERDIETVTVLSVEDVVKGNLSPRDEVKVRVTGGVTNKRIKLVFDAPRFRDGQRVLVFLTRLNSGDYAVTDFGLGLFGYATDDTGRSVLVRTTNEIHGWDLDGSVHHEPRRDAEHFLRFIRGVDRFLPVANDYTVEERPLIPDVPRVGMKLRPTVMATFTVTQYTLPSTTETSAGFRWNVFPSAVNWNKGSNETCGACNGGSDAINTAFSSWNGDPSSNVNYVFASTTPNTNGIEQAADGVNNIVFEKALSGIVAFSCSGGGVVGLGGITSGVSDGTNIVNGETFFKTTEADVSMNVGVGPCIGASPGIPVGDFNSGVTHEFGHTLGFRHSDKTRDNSLACMTNASYDCSSSAIMTAVVTGGLNGALQAWDQRAVAALYPGPTFNPPTNVVATATSGTNVMITWTAPGGTAPGRYNIYRTTNVATVAYTQINNTTSTSFNDGTAAANTSYMYKVRSADAGGLNESGDSNLDLATTVIFTNTLTPGVSVIQAVDMTELRTAVDKVRALGNTGAAFYSTDGTIVAGTTTVKAQNVLDLRTFVNVGRNNAGLVSFTFTNTLTPGSTLIKALDFNEIRAAVQ